MTHSFWNIYFTQVPSLHKLGLKLTDTQNANGKDSCEFSVCLSEKQKVTIEVVGKIYSPFIPLMRVFP